MAQNEYYRQAGIQTVPVAAGVLNGDPVAVGKLVGVAQADRDATAGTAPLETTAGKVFSLPVKGVDGAGNSAVAVGDYLYCVMADTPHLSKKATGVLFGKALGTVTAGSTATIQVLLIQA